MVLHINITKQVLDAEQAQQLPTALKTHLVAIMKSQFGIHVEWINNELWTDEVSERYLNASSVVYALIIGARLDKESEV